MARILGLTLGALLVLALSAPAASASPSRSAAACPAQTTEHPFTRWLDPFPYVLVPNGGLEQGSSGWTLTGGARVVEGNEPFFVRGTGDHLSLYLPRGSTATTPPTCVGLLHPTLRLFVQGSSLLGKLKVEVIYKTALGVTIVQPVLNLPTLTTAWQPTEPMLLLANVTGTLLSLDGLTTTVQLRFSPTSLPLLGGSFRIDDVYVDPWFDE